VVESEPADGFDFLGVENYEQPGHAVCGLEGAVT
jgi:hypothetical protein